jgi:hypothetical protein
MGFIASTGSRAFLLCVMYLLGLPDKKMIPRNPEQMENLDFSVGIPSVSQNGKARNSIPNHSAKDKNAQKSILKHSGKMKTFCISFRTILLELPFRNIQRRKKTRRISFKTKMEAKFLFEHCAPYSAHPIIQQPLLLV